jgi:hypothetical protein
VRQPVTVVKWCDHGGSQDVTKGGVGRGNRVAAWRATLYTIKGRSPVRRSQMLPDEATTVVTWSRGSSWLASPHCQLMAAVSF